MNQHLLGQEKDVGCGECRLHSYRLSHELKCMEEVAIVQGPEEMSVKPKYRLYRGRMWRV